MKYFKRKEFSCKCGCGFDVIDVELAEILEELREAFNSPVYINSACRCLKHNKEIGGSTKSQHLLGKAADIEVKGITPSIISLYLDNRYSDRYGIGNYNTFTHIDCRSNKARWNL